MVRTGERTPEGEGDCVAKMAKYWLERPGKNKKWDVGSVIGIQDDWLDHRPADRTFAKLRKYYGMEFLGLDHNFVARWRIVSKRDRPRKKQLKKHRTGGYTRRRR